MQKIILKPGKEQSIYRFHPWIFSGAIKTITGNPREGDPVEIFSSADECLGTGHFQQGSITVRMLSFKPAKLDSTFWKGKIINALELRKVCNLAGSGHTDAYRLVNAEGDGMPGMIIDFYNGTAVMQAHAPGMYMIRNQLAEVLKDVLKEDLTSVYYRSAPGAAGRNGRQENGYLTGGESRTIITEYGHKFSVDLEGGQKTGFFIDQRENRKLLMDYSQGKKVLNMFGYTGGFSVYALSGGASLVDTVDSSAKAVEKAHENVELNFPSDKHHKAYCADVFDFFREQGNVYDIVILDPPAFAKGMKARNNALQAYRRLNTKALEKISPGGLLFTFSCSQVVSKEQFRQAVYSAALQSEREIRVLHQLSQPADHPVSIYHPEGEYLKGLVLQVL